MTDIVLIKVQLNKPASDVGFCRLICQEPTTKQYVILTFEYLITDNFAEAAQTTANAQDYFITNLPSV